MPLRAYEKLTGAFKLKLGSRVPGQFLTHPGASTEKEEKWT